jgi:hypothetical protein
MVHASLSCLSVKNVIEATPKWANIMPFLQASFSAGDESQFERAQCDSHASFMTAQRRLDDDDFLDVCDIVTISVFQPTFGWRQWPSDGLYRQPNGRHNSARQQG